MEAKRDYDLTSWYLNFRRIRELVGPIAGLPPHILIPPDNIMMKSAIAATIKDAICECIKQREIKTLGELMISRQLKAGSLFTHYSNFFCKGLVKHHPDSPRTKKALPPPSMYSKLDDLKLGTKVSFTYDPVHLVSNSAWGMLAGQKQLFVLGLVESVNKTNITAIPYIVATLIPDMGEESVKGSYWANRNEVFIDQIDSFSKVTKQELRLKLSHLNILKGISEERIKKAFQDIIREPVSQKDWGGERSDLYSTHLKINGHRLSTSLLFKGPSKFHPMTMADLGKRGDQIPRLVSEHADLLLLQHCHQVTPFVRSTFRAYAVTSQQSDDSTVPHNRRHLILVCRS